LTIRARTSPERGVSAPRPALELGVSDLGHLVQPLATRFSAHDVGRVAVRPIEAGDRTFGVVAQCRVVAVRARRVEREALAGLALIHEERRGATRTRQQPAADQLEVE